MTKNKHLIFTNMLTFQISCHNTTVFDIPIYAEVSLAPILLPCRGAQKIISQTSFSIEHVLCYKIMEHMRGTESLRPVSGIHAVEISCLRSHRRRCSVIDLIPSHGNITVMSVNSHGESTTLTMLES